MNTFRRTLASILLLGFPAMATARAYPAGFTNALEVVGSHYPQPGTGSAPAVTNGAVVFSGGNLVMPLTNTFRLGLNGRTSNTGTHRFSLAFRPGSGWFSGTFKHPLSGKSTSVKKP